MAGATVELGLKLQYEPWDSNRVFMQAEAECERF